MRVLVRVVLFSIFLGHLSLCIRLPGQKIDKDTLTTLGIKTLGWQGEDNANVSVPQVHHNYSKVSVQSQHVTGFSQTSQGDSQKFSRQSSGSSNGHNTQDFYQSQVSGFGQQAVDEDDYFDLPSQSEELTGKNQQLSSSSQIQHGSSSSSHTWFGGQQQVDLDADELSQYSDGGHDQFSSQSSQGQSHVSHHQQSSKYDQLLRQSSQSQSHVNQHQQSSKYNQLLSQSSQGQSHLNQNQQSTKYDQHPSQSSQGQSHINQNQQSSKFTNVDQGQSQHSFVNQNQNSLTSTSDGQREVDYDDLSTGLTNSEIYNAHSYGSTPQLDDVMEAESYLQSQQQFEDFPDYELGQLQLVDQNAESSSHVGQEERQAKKFYSLDKPIYIHGYKYPPDPKDINSSNKQTPGASSEIYNKCPKMATGQFVYTASCNQFLNCWKGRGFVQNCAPGTLFNPKTLECDFASKVKCITGPRKPESKQYPTNQKIEISCPADFSGVVPHHSDCSKFINCANGVEHVMDCPPGTLFSLKINNCDFPYRAECASWSVYFGNITGYSLQSGGSGKFNYIAGSENHQGGGLSSSYGQENYLQSGTSQSGYKYISTDDFRLHQGYGINTAANQNQGSGAGTHYSSSQQSGYNHGQGYSNTNQNVHGQNAFGTGQGVTTKVETGQTSHRPVQGFYIVRENPNQYQQGTYGQHQQNLHGIVSQHTDSTQTGLREHQGLLSGPQGAYYGSSNSQTGLSSQDSTVLGEDYNKQGHHAAAQSQSLHGKQSFHGQGQEQNQGFSGNTDQYLSGSQGHYIDGSQGHYLGGSQSHYLGGSQNHYLGGSQSHYLGGSQSHSLGGSQGQYQSGSQGQYQGGSQGQYQGGSQGQYQGGIQGHYQGGSQGQYQGGSQGQYLSGSENFEGQSQTYYDQNQETLEGQNLQSQNKNYIRQNQQHLESQNVHGSQNIHDQKLKYHGQNQQIQSQYLDGNQQLYGHHQQFYEQNVNKNLNQDAASSTPSKYTATGKPKCPEEFTGLVPHPSDCSKFLNCANGQTFVQNCGPGTVFNPDSKVCDFPYKVKCQQSEDYSKLIDVRIQPNISINQQHKQKQGAGIHNDHYTSQGSSVVNQWQINQNVDSSRIKGQSQRYQGQTQTSSGVYQQTLDHSGSLSKSQDYQSKSGSQGSITFGSDGIAECPQHASGLYPHPTICSKFLNCANGQTVIQDCGPGTVFDPTSKVCDFPYKVKCQESEDYSKLINVRTEQHQHQRQDANTHDQYVAQGSTAHQWKIENSVDGSNSKAQGQINGTGGKTQTSSGIYQETLDNSESSSAGQNYYSTGGTQKLATSETTGSVKCPQHASGFYPHPTTCSKFLNCADGKTVIQDCGPGTVFDPKRKMCDFPYNVECGSGVRDIGTNTLDIQSHKQQQGFHEQNQIGGGKQQGSYNHGQTSVSSQQEFYNQNALTDSFLKGQQELSGQSPSVNKHGSYDQNQIDSSKAISGSGTYGVTGQSSYGHKQIDSSKVVSGQGTYDAARQGSYGHNQIDSSKVVSGQETYGVIGQGPYSHGQTGSTSTTGQKQHTTSTWDQKQQGGFYDQSKGSDGHQQVQGNYNQQTHGSGSTHQQRWYTHTGSQAKPIPFPSTDINADYEFGSESGGLEVNSLSVQPKVTNYSSKRKTYCEPLDYRCSVDDCIPQSMVCDGTKDCPDGSDEQKCEKYIEEFALTPNTILAVREKEKFLNISLIYCAKSCVESKGFKCKSFSYRKDDGACFLSDLNVGRSGALIISHPYNYYELKAFTVNCTHLYKCPNQKCINFKQVCDGINDCGDRTDEKGCSAEAFGYQIRLGGTDKKHEGRIEINAFGRWGYVCDDKFGLRDADVVCRELGFPLGSLEVKANSYYAQDLKPKDVFYLMDDVTCLGNETTVRDCDFNGWGVNNCEPQEVVGIVCKTPLQTCPKDYWKCDSVQECIPLNFVCDGVFDCTDQSDEASKHCEAPVELRLANGKSKHEGRVEIRYHGIWGTVCDDDFNDDSAKVVCKHLGFPGKAVAKKDGFFGAGKGPIWLDQVFCQGNESALEHCVHWNWGEHNCEHAEDVGVVCNSTYDNTGHERNVKLGQRNRAQDTLPEYLFPDRCGLRKDDQFLEDDEVHFRVVKGSSATKGDYPWQASLRIKNKLKPIHWCGAVVISPKFVLTAAHCLAGFAKGAYFVVAGDYDTDEDEGTEQEAYIEEFLIHDEFRSGQKMNNDIALIKLKGEGLAFTKDVQPICLPDVDLEYTKGLNCTISGFGTIESGKSGYSHQLRAGWIPLQSREICKMPHVYGSTITDGMVCAGSLDEGVDACDGDSGGPLACLHDGLFTLYGITSWGHHCGYANKPGVYVKVSHYRKWIDETIKKLS